MLASLALIGCRDTLQPGAPRIALPSTAIAPTPAPTTNECANPPAGTIWCDDFEVDRASSYFERLSPNTFLREAGVGYGGSYGMSALYQPGVPQAGDLKVAFGRSPDPDYVKPVDAGTTDYRDIYWRVYLKNQADWSGGGGGAFTRAMVLASSSWAQAAVGHVFAPDGDALLLDPVRGTDEGGTLVTTDYNDVDHFAWLGTVRGATPVFDGAHVGQWYCLEAHMKLNDPGQANGVLEYWINGALDAQRTGLNFVGVYTAFGINAIFFENYWSATAPSAESRYWDNIVVATQRIGCGESTSYSVTDLGALGGDWSWVTGINGRGQVIGYSYTRASDPQRPDLQWDTRHAFLWESGVLQDLGTLGGAFSHARAINDAGQIVGQSETGSFAQHAFLWENGAMQDLGGGFSDAVAINAVGDVVGQVGFGGALHAALWQNGTLRDLGTLGGLSSEASAINARGQVAGNSAYTTGSGAVHAFLWENGSMQDLGTLGGDLSAAVAMNDSGQVVGYSRAASGATHAFLWASGAMHDLGTLGGAASRADAINNRGQVVGTISSAAGPAHAFLWQNGTMQDLGDLGGASSFAVAITDGGQVVGYTVTSGVAHGFVWVNGAKRDLGALGGAFSNPSAVNTRGQVVGYAETASSAPHAALWMPSATP